MEELRDEEAVAREHAVDPDELRDLLASRWFELLERWQAEDERRQSGNGES